MSEFTAEFVGTALLVLLGDGVVANVVLKGTKGENAGWIVVTFGWGMAVFVAVFSVGAFSGAHINPAVTVGLAMSENDFGWDKVPIYLAAQMLGAALGAVLVWLQYRDHFEQTEDQDSKLGVFCTIPAIRNGPTNLLCEIIGTFVLVFAVLCMVKPDVGLGPLDALPVGLLVLAIGLSLGGTTGYAINPARDLGPRIVHAVVPISGKRDSDWGYAWIPVVGPIAGGALAAFVYQVLT